MKATKGKFLLSK